DSVQQRADRGEGSMSAAKRSWKERLGARQGGGAVSPVSRLSTYRQGSAASRSEEAARDSGEPPVPRSPPQAGSAGRSAFRSPCRRSPISKTAWRTGSGGMV